MAALDSQKRFRKREVGVPFEDLGEVGVLFPRSYFGFTVSSKPRKHS